MGFPTESRDARRRIVLDRHESDPIEEDPRKGSEACTPVSPMFDTFNHVGSERNPHSIRRRLLYFCSRRWWSQLIALSLQWLRGQPTLRHGLLSNRRLLKWRRRKLQNGQWHLGVPIIASNHRDYRGWQWTRALATVNAVIFLSCGLVMMRSNYPNLTRRRTSRLGSSAVIPLPFQHGSNQSLVMERTKTVAHSEVHRRPSVLVVGGSDGSGTRVVVELLGRLGVPMLVDDTGTYDVDALVLDEGEAEQGWPPLVRSVLEFTRSANYELDGLPPNALRRFRDQLATLRTSYESRADELLRRIDTNRQTRPAIIQYGFKAPVSMLLLPLLLDVFGSIKFLHVVRDGRDVAVSDNQSPVNKFYQSFYPQEHRETIDGDYWADKPDLKSAEKYIRAMRLWNDWNEQACAWSQSHVDDDAFDYHLIRSEDLISDPQRRVETVQQLAVFVGSPRSSPGELCCLSHHLEFDFGTSTSSSTSVTSQAQQRMPPWKRRVMMPFADPQTLEDRGTEDGTEFLVSNLESLYDSWKDATKSAGEDERQLLLGRHKLS